MTGLMRVVGRVAVAGGLASGRGCKRAAGLYEVREASISSGTGRLLARGDGLSPAGGHS